MSKAAAIIIAKNRPGISCGGKVFNGAPPPPSSMTPVMLLATTHYYADNERTHRPRRLLRKPAAVSRLHRGDGPEVVYAAAQRLGRGRGRRGAIDQGHRREPLQGGEHGRRRGDRRGDQRHAGAGLP